MKSINLINTFFLTLGLILTSCGKEISQGPKQHLATLTAFDQAVSKALLTIHSPGYPNYLEDTIAIVEKNLSFAKEVGYSSELQEWFVITTFIQKLIPGIIDQNIVQINEDMKTYTAHLYMLTTRIRNDSNKGLQARLLTILENSDLRNSKEELNNAELLVYYKKYLNTNNKDWLVTRYIPTILGETGNQKLDALLGEYDLPIENVKLFIYVALRIIEDYQPKQGPYSN